MKIRHKGGEYVKCELCEKFATLENADRLGWDWFTGYLSRCHHYCKKHTGTPDYLAAKDASQMPKIPKRLKNEVRP